MNRQVLQLENYFFFQHEKDMHAKKAGQVHNWAKTPSCLPSFWPFGFWTLGSSAAWLPQKGLRQNREFLMRDTWDPKPTPSNIFRVVTKSWWVSSCCADLKSRVHQHLLTGFTSTRIHYILPLESEGRPLTRLPVSCFLDFLSINAFPQCVTPQNCMAQSTTKVNLSISQVNWKQNLFFSRWSLFTVSALAYVVSEGWAEVNNIAEMYLANHPANHRKTYREEGFLGWVVT